MDGWMDKLLTGCEGGYRRQNIEEKKERQKERETEKKKWNSDGEKRRGFKCYYQRERKMKGKIQK